MNNYNGLHHKELQLQCCSLDMSHYVYRDLQATEIT